MHKQIVSRSRFLKVLLSPNRSFEFLINHFAPEMQNSDVCFLDSRSSPAWNNHCQFARGRQGFATCASECDRQTSNFASLFNRLQDVQRLSTRANRNQNVARLRQTSNLTGEYLLVTKVVTNRRQGRSVRCQGNCRK